MFHDLVTYFHPTDDSRERAEGRGNLTVNGLSIGIGGGVCTKEIGDK